MTSNFDPQKFIGFKKQDVQTTFTQTDAILYAIGIGFSQVFQDPLKESDFKYTYQLNDQFTVFPTFGTCFNKINLIQLVSKTPGWPQFNPALLLHAQQKIQMIASCLKANVPYVTKGTLKDVIDKGKITLVCFDLDVYEKIDSGLKLVAKNETTLALLKFDGKGFKGKGNISKLPTLPKRKPDYILEASTFPGQAILYRLTGDRNPLHIDPKIAAIQELPKPILHGLASKGILTRTIIQKLFNNDATKLKKIHSRFTGHIFSGQNFQINVWKQLTYYAFQAKCKERGTTAVTGVFQIRQKPKL